MVNSRNKGLTAERAVANYLKDNGFPDARRSVATGWSTANSQLPDRGDIDGVRGLAIQVKNLARRLEGKLLIDTWRATVAQAAEMTRQTGAAHRPIIIEKRAGSADVGRWWLHTDTGILVRMLTGRWQWVGPNFCLVRVEVGDVINDLRIWSNEPSD